MPTKQWQIEKLEDFSKLRKFIELKNINGTKEISHIMRWKETVMSKPPAFMEIATLSQSSKIQLLQLISQIIGELDTCTTISDATGTWIYGLLATLDIPLSPGACYHLRELSRKCSIVRSRLSTSSCKNMYIQLNLFICIVSNYFKQLDLADPVT